MRKRILIRWLVPAVVALALLPWLGLAMSRALDPATQEDPALRHLPEWYGPNPVTARRQAQAHLELAQAIRLLAAEVPATECVYSIKPVLIAYYGQRDSFTPPYETVDDMSFAAGLRSKNCRYFILLAVASPTYPSRYYPRDRLGERLKILSAQTSKKSEPGAIIAALGVLAP